MNEDYPPECIRFHSILDTTYLRFRIDGSAVSTAQGIPMISTVEQKIPDSLPLKPSRREMQLSPGRSRVSSEEVRFAETPMLESVETAEIVEKEPSNNLDIESVSRERDALDDIIDESKATSHLVSRNYELGIGTAVIPNFDISHLTLMTSLQPGYLMMNLTRRNSDQPRRKHEMHRPAKAELVIPGHEVLLACKNSIPMLETIRM